MLIFKKRVREIGAKAFSLSGQISSKKLNKAIQFESSLERDFIYLLEFDNTVEAFLEQPIEILYKYDGIIKKYTPDFIVSYDDRFRKDEIIEIKYEKDLIKNNPEMEIKFEAARKYCVDNNLLFRVCSDKYIRDDYGIRLNNIKFLSWYRDYYDNIDYQVTNLYIDSSYSLIILDRIKHQKNCTINQVLDSITNDEQKRAELIFSIWYLIANNFILCNLNKILNLNSKIWID